MFGKIFEYFKNLFSPPIVEELPKQPGFSAENPWLFPGAKPTDHDIQNLMNHLVLEDGHAFYMWNGEKKKVLRVQEGTPLYARRIVWWLEGRGVPESASGAHPVGIRSNCGEVACIKLSHLILDQPQRLLGPENKPQPKPVPVIVRKKGPPEFVPRGKRNRNAPPNPDRAKCISSKAWFATDAEAYAKAKELNDPKVRGTGKRVYPYKCDLACGGHHLTSTNPKNRKDKKPKGSWS